ncbi:MAG: lipase family protein [Thiohalomonadales bacterium]
MNIHKISIFFHIIIVFSIGFIPDVSYAKHDLDKNPVNFKLIKDYANLASAAYKTSSNLKKTKFLNNYSLTHYNAIDELGISYFLITNDKTRNQSIAIRGTSNIENTMANLSVKLTFDNHTGIYLHQGYLLIAQAIYSELKDYIKKDYTINATGHSMGGAVALILAMALDKDKVKIGEIVTFGQPKITNLAGAYKFQHLNITRVVTPKDLIPLVPLIDPMDINDLDIYWHQGKEILLLPGSRYSVLEGLSSMLRATRFTQEMLNEDNILNHQMRHYQAMLNKKIPDSKLVPYKNDFNLFNLFSEKSSTK